MLGFGFDKGLLVLFMASGLGLPPGGAPADPDPMMASVAPGAAQAVQAEEQRMQTIKNLKQIMLAMHKYHDTSKAFPAAYSVDDEGTPLLSWRVHILPFIEQGALYEQFRLDEPWDSDHNRKLIRQMPAVYRSPGSKSEPGKTNYLGNAAEDGIFLSPAKDQQNPQQRMPVGSAIRDVDDGVSNTIGIVEVRDELAVVWTKPDDFQPPKEDPSRGLIGLHKGGFWAAFCDGSVQFVPEGLERMEVLFTRAGGEFAPNF